MTIWPISSLLSGLSSHFYLLKVKMSPYGVWFRTAESWLHFKTHPFCPLSSTWIRCFSHHRTPLQHLTEWTRRKMSCCSGGGWIYEDVCLHNCGGSGRNVIKWTQTRSFWMPESCNRLCGPYWNTAWGCGEREVQPAANQQDHRGILQRAENVMYTVFSGLPV